MAGFDNNVKLNKSKQTLYFISWHFKPTTAWWPITLLHPIIVWPGMSAPTTAPLPKTDLSFFLIRSNQRRTNTRKNDQGDGIMIGGGLLIQTYVCKIQWSPNCVSPKTWLPGYNWQAFPIFASDPTVQNGPIETPYNRKPWIESSK